MPFHISFDFTPLHCLILLQPLTPMRPSMTPRLLYKRVESPKLMSRHLTKSEDKEISYRNNTGKEMIFDDYNLGRYSTRGALEHYVTCRAEPFNTCYYSDTLGNLHPIRKKKPMRAIRIYG